MNSAPADHCGSRRIGGLGLCHRFRRVPANFPRKTAAKLAAARSSTLPANRPAMSTATASAKATCGRRWVLVFDDVGPGDAGHLETPVEVWNVCSLTEAVRLARQAVEGDRDDPDVLWMAGFTLSVIAGEHTTAASVINRALAFTNSAHALVADGWVSCSRGARHRERTGRGSELQQSDVLLYLVENGPGRSELELSEAIYWRPGSKPAGRSPLRLKHGQGPRAPLFEIVQSRPSSVIGVAGPPHRHRPGPASQELTTATASISIMKSVWPSGRRRRRASRGRHPEIARADVGALLSQLNNNKNVLELIINQSPLEKNRIQSSGLFQGAMPMRFSRSLSSPPHRR